MSIKSTESELQPPDKGRCRCCLKDKELKDLSTDYVVDGTSENYGRMLMECFPSKCPKDVFASKLCINCVSQLRNMLEFKRNILKLHPYIAAPEIKVEIESEDTAIFKMDCPINILKENFEENENKNYNLGALNVNGEIVAASTETKTNCNGSKPKNSKRKKAKLNKNSASRIKVEKGSSKIKNRDSSDKTRTKIKSRKRNICENENTNTEYAETEDIVKTYAKTKKAIRIKDKSSKIKVEKGLSKNKKQSFIDKNRIKKSERLSNTQYINSNRKKPKEKDIKVETHLDTKQKKVLTSEKNSWNINLGSTTKTEQPLEDIILLEVAETKDNKKTDQTITSSADENYFLDCNLGSMANTEETIEDMFLLEVQEPKDSDIQLEQEHSSIMEPFIKINEGNENYEYLDGDGDFKQWKEVVGSGLNLKSEFNDKKIEKNSDADENDDDYSAGNNDLDDPDYDENDAKSNDASNFSDSDMDRDTDISEEEEEFKPARKRKKAEPRKDKSSNRDITRSTKPQYTKEEMKNAVQAVANGSMSRAEAVHRLKTTFQTLDKRLEEMLGVPRQRLKAENKPFLMALEAILTYTNATPFRSFKQSIFCAYCGSSRISSSRILSASELRAHRTKHALVTHREVVACVMPVKCLEIIKLDIAALQCTVCAVQLSWSQLFTHLLEAHAVDASAARHRAIPYHLTHHFQDIKCALCDHTADTLTNLDLHMAEHYPNHMCGTCGERFVSKIRLHSHELYKHNYAKIQPLQCDKCGKPLKTRRSLYKHMYLKHKLDFVKLEQRMYQCVHCPEVLANFSTLMLHDNNAHKSETVSCEFCSDKLENQAKYKYHLDTKHSAQMCTSKFFVLKHKIPNIGIPALAGAKSTSRKTPIRTPIHTPIRSTTCKLRGDAVNPTSKHQCKLCGTAFATKVSLKKHNQNLHLGDDVYFQCEFCKNRYGAKAYLTEHQKRCHFEQYMKKREAEGKPFEPKSKKLRRKLYSSSSNIGCV